MRILYIHNDYAKPSGEELASASLAALLKEHGHEVEFFHRSSEEIIGSALGKIKSFFSGIANPFAAHAVSRKLDDFRPDLVIVQNLYPLLSPSVLKPIKSRGIPMVMRCPNYRLFCPIGLCYDGQAVCEECFGGHEWRCFLKNCTGSVLKSLGYAVRGWCARVSRRILDNVNIFIVQTEYQRQKFIQQGLAEDKLAILPGIMPDIEPPGEWQPGEYVTFIGRVSPEKGIDDFLDAARQLPEIPFRVAGSYECMPDIKEQAPANIEWMGFLKGESLRLAYLNSRIIVVPSKWYEGFPNVIVMGMMLGRPIVTANIGATGSIIKEGVTGELFEPGNASQLAQKIQKLYNKQEECRRYGEAGRAEALQLYSRDKIYLQLMETFQLAQSRCPDGM